MAASAILAAGTTAATSSAVTLADGASTNLVVFEAAGGSIPADAVFEVKIKNSVGGYTAIARLTGGVFATGIVGPGEFYVDRKFTGASGASLGVDQN